MQYRLIELLVQNLPPTGAWTAGKRQRWLTAVEKSIDLLIDVQVVHPPLKTGSDLPAQYTKRARVYDVDRDGAAEERK